MLRAAQIAPRGFAKIAIGGLESYRGTDKQIDELLRHKADVCKIVETYTGDGNFQSTIDKDPKACKLTVRATGKSLSEVVPAGVPRCRGRGRARSLFRDEASRPRRRSRC